MSPAQARRYVVVGVLGVGVVTTMNAFSEGHPPTIRTGIGLAALAVMLGIGAELAPELAAGFAVLALVTSLFVQGGPTFAAISRKVAA